METYGKLTLFLSVILIVSAVPASAQDFEQYKLHSMYTDYKAKEIGDIVTILIVEATSGAQGSDAKSKSDASLDASGKVTGNLTDFLPLFGMSSDLASESSSRANTSQTDNLTGKITAVVTEILPTGNLRLQGTRRLAVNGEQYVLEVNGIARQRDITSDNIVLSYNLANVEIDYQKDGLINKFGKPGLITRWSTVVLAGVLGAAALLGVSAAASGN
jgi:flagellar L-ring protein precursor FlgH